MSPGWKSDPAGSAGPSSYCEMTGRTVTRGLAPDAAAAGRAGPWAKSAGATIRNADTAARRMGKSGLLLLGDHYPGRLRAGGVGVEGFHAFMHEVERHVD